MDDRSAAAASASYSTDPPSDNHAPSVMEVDSRPDDRARQASVLSMDDLEAAQALEGLRSGGWNITLSSAASLMLVCWPFPPPLPSPRHTIWCCALGLHSRGSISTAHG